MKYSVLIIFLFFFCTLRGQIIQKDIIDSKFSVGTHFNLFYFDKRVDLNRNEFARIISIELPTYFSYNIYRNLYIGSGFSQELFLSNFYKKKNIKEIGVFSRYILPYVINNSSLKRIHLYFEIGYYKTNYKKVSYVNKIVKYKGFEFEEDFIIGNKLDVTKITTPIGLLLFLKKRLYIDLKWQNNIYVGGKSMNFLMGGVGYNFKINETPISVTY